MNKVINTVKINASIIATLALSKGEYIDDHGHGREKPVRKASAVATFTKNGREHVVLLNDSGYFCINPLELDDDGTVHLSTFSVGGVVNSPNMGSLKAGVDAYNFNAATAPWDIGTIGDIIRF